MNDRLRRALMLLVILVVLAGLWFLPFGQLLNSAASWSQAHTIASPIMYLILFPICVVLLVPASWIAIVCA